MYQTNLVYNFQVVKQKVKLDSYQKFILMGILSTRKSWTVAKQAKEWCCCCWYSYNIHFEFSRRMHQTHQLGWYMDAGSQQTHHHIAGCCAKEKKSASLLCLDYPDQCGRNYAHRLATRIPRPGRWLSHVHRWSSLLLFTPQRYLVHVHLTRAGSLWGKYRVSIIRQPDCANGGW